MKIENINQYLFHKLDKLIDNGKLNDKKIVLFGLNTSSYSTKNYLEDKGYQITAYIDNDQKKLEDVNEMIDTLLPRQMSKEDYLRIKDKFVRAYTPDEFLGTFIDNVVILIASKYYVQMCKQLENMGYVEEKHIIKTADFYDLNHVLTEDWMEGLRELQGDEIRQIQLQILEYLKKVCKENELRYYLCGGSLLGAIRHKGYIPWDDDIDVAMPLPDYKKLIELLRFDNRYQLVSIYNHPDEYYNFFMRMIDTNTVMKSWEYPFLMTSGVNIDIFPLFGMPDNNKEIDYFYNRIRNLNTRFIESYIEFSKETPELLKERAKLRKRIVDMMEQYPFDESERIGYLLSKYREKEIMSRSIYDKMIEVPFENSEFSIASGHIEYLEIIFGDYMKLPSKTDQFTTHNYRAFMKE